MKSLDQLAVDALRMLSVDMIEKANSGHPGLPLGAAPMAYVLWRRHLRFSPENPGWIGRDRFLLSAGHGSALNYALLHLFGYSVSLDDLKDFRQIGSITPGHPEFGMTSGVEATTGPLGQGLAMAAGLAVAEQYVSERTGCPRRFTYGIVSDGDLMEGVAVEAASLAGHMALGHLVLLYDDNSISLDGPTDKAFTEDVPSKFTAMGWQTITVEDGNDLDAIDHAIVRGKENTDQPTLISVKTHIGFGSPKQDSSASHGAPLGGDAVKATREFFDWPQEDFFVPDEVHALNHESTDRGQELRKEWSAAVQELSDEAREELQLISSGALPQNWESALDALEFDGAMATRDAGKSALNAVAETIPWVVGGSADLASSTKTVITDSGEFTPDNPTGRNVWFGVREHAMGAMVNGMALGGLRSFGSTFLVFSDYMRGSIRLSGLMKTPVIWVYTHDSICVGEDGPTHQPIEQIMSMRLIPDLAVWRPADAYETAECWRQAISRGEPCVIVGSRQKLPVLTDQKEAIKAGVKQGGYVIREANGKPKAAILATGSEVSLALAAADALAADGIEVQVSSIPCWEVLKQQEQSVIDEVNPRVPTVSVEAGTTHGWTDWTGRCGANIGIDRFGESGPGDKVYEHFGFTVENVVKTVKELVDEGCCSL